jgi:uncharacterized protein (TIGR02270 family)
MNSQAATIPEIVSQFTDNCASLWHGRENVARSRTYGSRIVNLDRIDTRLDAQIDGLRVSGEAAWISAVKSLQIQGAGEFFTAALLAFDSGSDRDPEVRRLEILFESIKKPVKAFRPLTVALDWNDAARLPLIAGRISKINGPLADATAIFASSLSGYIPRERIVVALERGDPFLVFTACEIAVRTQERALLRPLETYMTDQSPEISVAAATAALILGSNRAIDVLARMTIDQALPQAEQVATTLFRSLSPLQALSMHRELFRSDKPTRASVRAAGAAGIRELVPFLIAAMDVTPVARLAGEVFSEITGVNLKDQLLTREAPEGNHGGPVEDPADENTDMDLDEGKLWPDGAGIEQWWHSHSFAFEPRTRYLAGSIVREDLLKSLLGGGQQTLRAAAAELLAFSGKPLFDVYAPAFRQAQRLGLEGAWG